MSLAILSLQERWKISTATNISKKNVVALLDTFQETITKTLKKGDDVNIIGFGSFKVIKTSARTGRNPQTGKEMKIKASKRVKFKVGQGLKDALK